MINVNFKIGTDLCCEKCMHGSGRLTTGAKGYFRKKFLDGDMQWPVHMIEILLCDKHAVAHEPFTGEIIYIKQEKQLALNYKH